MDAPAVSSACTQPTYSNSAHSSNGVFAMRSEQLSLRRHTERWKHSRFGCLCKLSNVYAVASSVHAELQPQGNNLHASLLSRPTPRKPQKAA
jgi:hypothetical protein